jgi:ABC-type sugar transport system permease subunit
MVKTTVDLSVNALNSTRATKLRQLPDSAFAYMLAMPALVVSLALLAYPLGYSFWVSLHAVTLGATGSWKWVGLSNYREAINGPLFWPAVKRTLQFSIVVVLLTTVLGMLIALVLNEPFRGRGILRAMLILPWSLSQITLALTFGWIFNSTFGPLNGALYDLGIIHQYVAWFASGGVALNVMAVALVWGLVPFATLLYLGALQTVPEELLKAGRVDGAGPVRRFFLITLPWIRETVVVVIVVAALNAFLSFGLIYILTSGGPGTETTVLSWWGYTTAFQDLDLGQGAAIFYLMTLMILGLSFLTILTLGRKPRT